MPTCKRCNAPIIFVKNARRKWMPVDAKPTPTGNVEIRHGVAVFVGAATLVQLPGKRYTSHFQTCEKREAAKVRA